MKCRLCVNKALAHVRWGTSDSQHGEFCENHIMELWQRTHSNVNENINYWIQTLIEEEVL